MIINTLDLGSPSHPFSAPVTGQEMGSFLIEGLEYAVWPRGSVPRRQIVSFSVKAWQAIGGQSANTSGAMKYLLKQLEELSSNRDQQPVYIQWNATADPAAILNATELHDGWYVINSFAPNYAKNVVTGLVQCTMTVTQVAAAPPRRHAISYLGGALTTTFSGQATNFVSLPVGATAAEAAVTRVTAEGSIPCILSPAASPEPFVPSATIANWYKGGVHVYDTINTGSNPVPTSGGTFVNANWVEVLYTDHDFQGDCVITNGLQLLLFQAGQARIATCYLWNPALAAANWQQYATLNNQDNGASNTTLGAYTLARVGQDECSLVAALTNSATSAYAASIRLQRGRYEGRIDFTPLTQATSNGAFLTLVFAGIPKIVYNSTHVEDDPLGEVGVIPATDYGFGAGFVANSADPFIAGFLYQNPPNGSQPLITGAGNTATIAIGETLAVAINATKAYGFFAIPYGVNASYSTANLQAEAESGSLGTGWTSQANASASGGNEAKCASGTLIGNADLWGTAFVPDPGVYDLWVRMKVTSNANAVAQMQVGLWNSDTSAYVASTTYAPNQLTTSYAWYRVAAGVTPTATKNMRVRAVTTGTLATDFFMDESSLNPLTLTTDNRGPQQLWQQFGFDRSTSVIQQ